MPTPPTTLVTGVAGRIGRGVASALRLAGHKIVGLDQTKADDLVGSTCDSFVQCDLAAAAAPGAAAATRTGVDQPRRHPERRFLAQLGFEGVVLAQCWWRGANPKP